MGTQESARGTCSVDLRKFIVPESVFGTGARHLAGNYAANMGAARILVVTDPGVRAVGWTDDVIESIKNQRLAYVVFDRVTSNPRTYEVMAGAEVYHSERCNSIIAVGGGSPMDCAKGIGIVVTNHGSVLDYEGVDMIRASIPPIICVPTTGGSAADVSQFAIITDTENHRKIAIVSKTLVPDVTLIDPVTLTSMPADLTVTTGLDTLTHAFEAYVSSAGSQLTDLLALEAARLISRYLAATVSDPSNIELRHSVALATMYAGYAFSNAGLGLVHALAHSLGGLIDSPHGESNAVLLAHVVKFNFDSAVDRYRDLSAAISPEGRVPSVEKACSVLLRQLHEIGERLGSTEKLGDIGVKPSDIPLLAANAMKDPDIATNPRVPTLQDIEAIYAGAL